MSKFFLEGDSGAAEDRNKYYEKLPVYAGGNVYFNGAVPMKRETDAYVDTQNLVRVELVEKDGEYYLDTNLDQYIPQLPNSIVSTEMLGEAFEPEMKFENPDGTPIIMKQDYFGSSRQLSPLSGPFADRGDFGRKL